ncbi:MAG: SDR family oxidoreductase [Bacteroidota bacterium]
MSAPVHVLLGGSGGIGSALARRLREAGDTVILGARDAQKLSALAGEIGAEAFTLDATEYAQVEALVKGAAERHGRVDGVVNLVGSIDLKPAHAMSVEAFQQVLQLNLHTAFYAVKAAASVMTKNRDPRGGAVVLMSSVAARYGLANHEAVASAKAGIEGLVRAAAATYAGRGIRVNAVAPGLVRTPLAGRLVASEQAVEASAAMHPIGRIGEPQDLVGALALLLDREQAGWITGETISVDGGFAHARPR